MGVNVTFTGLSYSMNIYVIFLLYSQNYGCILVLILHLKYAFVHMLLKNISDFLFLGSYCISVSVYLCIYEYVQRLFDKILYII